MILEALAEIQIDAGRADACAGELGRAALGLEAKGWPPAFRKLSGPEAFQALADAASLSGAAAFLLLQGFVAGGWMPAEDGARVGVAFGHLRDPSRVRLSERDGRLFGSVPWMTGAGWFDEAILGWVDSEGLECMGRVSAVDRPEFRHCPPMALTAMSSTCTVSVEVDGLEAPEPIRRQPRGAMAEGDRHSAAWQTPLMFGVISAAEREISAAGESAPRLSAAAAKLRDEADRAILHGASPARAATIRTRAARLAVEAARRSVAAARGTGILAGSAPERLVREALVIGQMAMTAPLRARALQEAVQ